MVKKASGSKAAATPIGAQARVVILHGKEGFLRGAYTDQLKSALEEDGRTVDVIRFEGASADVADVLDECRSLGLMGQHKLVLVDQADELVKDSGGEARGVKRPREMLERYADAPSEGATLILRSETWRPGKLDKLVAKVGSVIKCDDLTPQRAKAAVRKRAEETFGVSIEPAAVERLVERVGTGLARLDSELAKLTSAVGAGGVIDQAIVNRLVGLSREEKAWTIQDVLLDANPEAALLKLHELVEVSRVDLVPIRWACVDLVKKAHAVAQEIESGVPAHAAGKSQRLWGPSAVAIRELATRVGSPRLAVLLREAIETDMRAKTTQGDPVRGMERLILHFARVSRG